MEEIPDPRRRKIPSELKKNPPQIEKPKPEFGNFFGKKYECPICRKKVIGKRYSLVLYLNKTIELIHESGRCYEKWCKSRITYSGILLISKWNESTNISPEIVYTSLVLNTPHKIPEVLPSVAIASQNSKITSKLNPNAKVFTPLK